MIDIVAVSIVYFSYQILAAEEALPGWAQYGILGIIIIALVVTRQLVAGWVYAELKEELKEVKAENKRLVQTLIDNNAVTVPALSKSSEMLERAAKELERRGGSSRD